MSASAVSRYGDSRTTSGMPRCVAFQIGLQLSGCLSVVGDVHRGDSRGRLPSRAPPNNDSAYAMACSASRSVSGHRHEQMMIEALALPLQEASGLRCLDVQVGLQPPIVRTDRVDGHAPVPAVAALAPPAKHHAELRKREGEKTRRR